MNDACVDVAVRNLFSNPSKPIKSMAVPVLGIVAFSDHTSSGPFSSAVVYSRVSIRNSNAMARGSYHQGHSPLTNLVHHRVKQMTIGGGSRFGPRVNFTGGFNYVDCKMQFSFRYDWSKAFEF